METRAQGHIAHQRPWQKATHIPSSVTHPFRIPQRPSSASWLSSALRPFFVAPTALSLQAHPVPGFWDVAPFTVKSRQEEKVSCCSQAEGLTEVWPEGSAPASILTEERLQACTLTPWRFGKHLSAPSRTLCQRASEEEARSRPGSGSLLKSDRPAWTPGEAIVLCGSGGHTSLTREPRRGETAAGMS